MNYYIERADTMAELTSLVNEAIKDGFVPVGGVFVFTIVDIQQFGQAMIRKVLLPTR